MIAGKQASMLEDNQIKHSEGDEKDDEDAYAMKIVVKKLES